MVRSKQTRNKERRERNEKGRMRETGKEERKKIWKKQTNNQRIKNQTCSSTTSSRLSWTLKKSKWFSMTISTKSWTTVCMSPSFDVAWTSASTSLYSWISRIIRFGLASRIARCSANSSSLCCQAWRETMSNVCSVHLWQKRVRDFLFEEKSTLMRPSSPRKQKSNVLF